jgi:hypothetical protein
MEDNGLSNYTDAIGSLGGTAAGILGALKGGNKSAPAAAPASSGSPSWLPIALIGGGVLLVVLVIFGLRK